MISQLEGTLAQTGVGFVVLSVGGVGYKVFVTADTLRALSKKQAGAVRLFTYLAVRDDAMDLFGFEEHSELGFFELLLKVPGIGPKSALAVLSLAPIGTLSKAITAGDVAYLTKISGIGKKTAEKIVFTLKDDLGGRKGGTGLESATGLREESDAIEALKALGYSTAEAREALKKVPESVGGISEKVKEALKILGNQKK